jgi:hypothetical protein
MATIEQVHQQFGNAAEAAQLLETQLGNMMLEHHVHDENLIDVKNPKRAKELLNEINKHTLGQLLRKLHKVGDTFVPLEAQLEKALNERNRLSHQFFRHHNLRRNSDAGRDIMLKDLTAIHDCLIEAYKSVMLLDGIDLEAIMKADLVVPIVHEAQLDPQKRLPI